MGQDGLGRLFNIVPGIVPVDLRNATTAGKRVSLKNAGGVTFVFFGAAGTAADDPTVDIQEHDAATAGTSQDLDVVTYYHKIQETTLDGDEVWTKVTQSAASEVVGDGTSAEEQKIFVIEVDASQLSDGFEYVSAAVTVANAGAQLGCLLYIVRDLHIAAAPASLAQPQS